MDTPRGEVHLFSYFQKLKDHTVAVAPNSNETQEFLRRVNDLWQTIDNNVTHPINWLLFPTEEELLTAYWSTPDNIPIAVVFEEAKPITGPLKYKIRSNPSEFETPSTTELFSSPASCRESSDFWSGANVLPIETGNNCPVNRYYYSGFVALQALLDYTKIRVRKFIQNSHFLLFNLIFILGHRICYLFFFFRSILTAIFGCPKLV